MTLILERCKMLLVAMMLLGPARMTMAQPGGMSGVLTPKQLMAARLIMLSRNSLAGDAQVREDQLTRGRILLDMALELTGDDAELWRLRIELAQLTGDEAMRIKAMRNYLKLRSDDDAMQLELILGLVSREQTLDGRLGKVERILNAKSARQFSKALRSRLATYAALASVEMGDDQRYAKWLKYALVLDPANSEAAMMMYDMAIQRHGTPLQIGMAGVSVVRAGPLNASARTELATILLSQAVYSRAAQQFDVAGQLLTSPPDQRMFQMWVHSLACASRTDDALELLNQYQHMLEARKAASEKADETNDQPAHGEDGRQDDQPQATPGAVLPTELELIRLGIYTTSQDVSAQENAAMSFNRLRKSLLAQAEAGNDTALVDYQWVGAVFNIDAEAIERGLEQQSADDPLVQRARGFLAIHRGNPTEARSFLEPLAQNDDVAQYGLALLVSSNQAAKARALQAVIFAQPTGLGSLLASRRLAGTDADIKPTPVGRSLLKLMDRIWSKLWEMDPAMDRWVDVRLSVEPTRVDYMHSFRARLSLRNATILPLAMGSQQPLPASALLSLTPFVGGQPVGATPPLVIALDRRLTLQPGETTTVDVRLEQTLLGEVIWSNPSTTFSFNAAVIIDPQAGRGYGISTSMLGSRKTIRALNAVGHPMTDHSLEQWLEDIDGTESSQRMASIACLTRAVSVLASTQEKSKSLGQVTAAINEHYPQFDPLRQAWTVSFVSREDQTSNLLERVIAMAQRSPDQLVRVVYLATQVVDADDPGLAAAQRVDDPLIREFATALAAGIAAAAEAEAEAARETEAQEAAEDQ